MRRSFQCMIAPPSGFGDRGRGRYSDPSSHYDELIDFGFMRWCKISFAAEDWRPRHEAPPETVAGVGTPTPAVTTMGLSISVSCGGAKSASLRRIGGHVMKLRLRPWPGSVLRPQQSLR